MRGTRQRNISPGPSQNAPEQGAESGLVKRLRGRQRKEVGVPSAAQASAVGDKEENSGGVQEGQLLKPAPDDNILSFKCFGCGNFYSTKASLNSHKYVCKRRLKQKRQFPCTVCGKQYGSKQYMKIHMEHSHGDNKEPQIKRAISKRVVNKKKTVSRTGSARVKKV